MSMTAPQFNIRPQQQRAVAKPKRDRYEEQIEKANSSRKQHKQQKIEQQPAAPVETITKLYINGCAYMHRHIFNDTESLKDGFLTAMQLLDIDKNSRSRLVTRAFTLAQESLIQIRETMGNHPSVQKKIDELSNKLMTANNDMNVLIPHAFRNEFQAYVVNVLGKKPSNSQSNGRGY